MGDWTKPRTGGCRCGDVRFEVRAQPLLTMACHCTGCQKMTGSAFSLSAAIPSEGFAVTRGEPVLGGMRGAHRQFFCAFCMSWLFTRAEAMDWFVNVRSTMLDDTRGTEPFVETWVSEKLPWAFTPARHGFAQFPPMEAYAGLAESYAAERATG